MTANSKAEVVFSSIAYGGKNQTVALFPGLSVDELSSLLKTIFGIPSSQTIVGVNAERGLVIPLSLVCRSPSIIPNSVCKLLITPPPPKDGNASLSNGNVDDVETIVDESPEPLTDSTEFVMQEILKFIDSLHKQKFLDSAQKNSLSNLLVENSTLLFAAYSVAVSANDSEYLAEICKDLAVSMSTEQGRLACEAQDEVLQVCDQLYLNEKITENQLLYLRHLVLIREEPVAALYDDFQEHQSVPLLAKALYELAFTHPYLNQASATASNANANKPAKESQEKVANEVDSDDDDDEEDLYEKEKVAQKAQIQSKEKSSSNGKKQSSNSTQSSDSATAGLTGVLTLMIRTKSIEDDEAVVLFDMIRNKNEYVLAAYELYNYDSKLDELQDTLLRCAKLELRKKAAAKRESSLNAAQKEYLYGDRTDGAEVKDEQEDEELDDDEEEEEEEDEEEEDKQEEGDDEGDNLELEDIGLDSILESLDVVNIWSNSVPDKFIHAVFIAVIRSQLSVAQAKAVCDLFHADYDLVRAAWEVFSVQKDKDDFIDSLRRIVRDLEFDEDGMIPELKPSTKSTSSSSSASAAASKQKSSSNGAGSSSQTGKKASSAPSGPAAAQPARAAPSESTSAASKQPQKEAAAASTAASSHENSAQRSEILDRKKEAIAAVAAAKKDLLKHSLDMMVAQGLTSAASASGLIERYSHGDSLVDAAIEAYAADKDVSEFLDTLHIIANHSKEQLEAMMRQTDDPSSASDSKKESGGPSATASAPSLVIPQAVLDQIVGIVEEMGKNEMITPAAEEILRDLVRKQDSRVISAFKTYVQVRDGADLIDSLLRIAAYETAQQKSSSSATTSKSSGSSNGKPSSSSSGSNSASVSSNGKQSAAAQEEQADDEGEDESDAVSLLSAEDQKTVVQILLRANAIDGNQSVYLNELIDDGNGEVRKVFLAYEKDKDVYKLIASLKTHNKPSATDSDSYEDDFEEDVDEDDRGSVEERFFNIIKEMNLTHLETAALRLVIARDDETVREVIKKFKQDRNEEALKRALRALAQKTINETIEEDEGGDADEEKEDDEQDDEDEEDDNDDENDGEEEEEEEDEEFGNDESKEKFDFSSTQRPSSAQYQSYWSTIGRTTNSFSANRGPSATISKNVDVDDEDDDGGDDDEEDDEDESEEESGNDRNDDEDGEEDDEDEEGGGSRQLTSQVAREHVFPFLVAELVKENIIGRKEADLILTQFNEGNPFISAALDSYDRNNDMSKLVETLQQTVAEQA